MNNEEILDLVIIGASAAGLSAAVYACRRNLNFKIVTQEIGGEVALSGEVNNWPGIISISGFELAQNFQKHVESYGQKIDQGYRVESLTKEGKFHVIKAVNLANEEKIYKTKAIIIASGIHPRTLGVEGETEFRGRGVTYCTVCDGPLFRNRTTITVGAGNSALESVLMLSTIAKKAYIMTIYENSIENKGGFPRAEDILIDKVKSLENIEIIYNANLKKIVGKDFVEKIIYEDLKTHEEKELGVEGVMVHIGQIPNSDFVSCGSKNRIGEIQVDTKCKTDCEGIFAAGDVTDVPFKQIIIASGHGATAALSAIEYINKFKE
ncbi:MAG: FAD-dependent oxidoreductase [Patescibacteria group bacterium]